jgi:hypothetical protein
MNCKYKYIYGLIESGAFFGCHVGISNIQNTIDKTIARYVTVQNSTQSTGLFKMIHPI